MTPELWLGVILLVVLCLLVGGATGGFDDRGDFR